VGPDDLRFICKNIRLYHYAPGERIMDYKSTGNEFYMLLKGKALILQPKKKIIVTEVPQEPFGVDP